MGLAPLPPITPHLLPSSRGIPPVSPGERALLTQALREGNRLFWSAGVAPREGLSALDAARRFLFRRWVLEAVLALAVQGPSSFNSLSNALGRPAGESIAPKLEILRRANLLTRSVAAPVPLRVEYSLTLAGEKLGECVYLMMRWKGIEALETRHPGMELPDLQDLSRPSVLDPIEVRAALDRYFSVALSFGRTRVASCRPREFEAALAMTQRFCRAWVHKWHGRILLALAVEGPMRFADIRSSLGIGDQALALALAGLLDMRSIEPSGITGSQLYQVSPFGWSDLSLSAPLIMLGREAIQGTLALDEAPLSMASRGAPIPD